MKPHGRALLDYLNGETSAQIVLAREDGKRMDVPVSLFFRGPSEFLALDLAAIEVCRDRVLDLGAGAGSHSLALQERGLSVFALDFLPEACVAMRRRGVREVHCAHLADFDAEPFDTILMMMNGIGIVETVAGLRLFLDDIRRLLRPDGQIVFDSADLRCGADLDDQAYQDANRRAGRFWGEYRFHLEYRGETGPEFGALFVDSDRLRAEATNAGWHCDILFRDKEGAYLARLTQA